MKVNKYLKTETEVWNSHKIHSGMCLGKSLLTCIETARVSRCFPVIHIQEHKYLLLTEFEVRTVSYGPSFSSRIYGPNVKRTGHKSERKKRGSVTYSTDRENEVCKIFIISQNKLLNLAGRTVKYGPLDWPITARVLTERCNNVRRLHSSAGRASHRKREHYGF